jgi:hypothetical protein
LPKHSDPTNSLDDLQSLQKIHEVTEVLQSKMDGV